MSKLQAIIKGATHRGILCLLCALLLLSGNLFIPSLVEEVNKEEAQLAKAKSPNARAKTEAQAKHQTPPRIRPAPPAEPEEGGMAEDIEGRDDWFMFQRMYPTGTIPPDARLRAWQSIPKTAPDSRFAAAASRNWQPIGPSPTNSAFPNNWGPTSGRVLSIAVSPANSRVVIVGSATGGLWRSDNAGASFEPVSDDQVDLAVGSVAFSESNPSIVYAGMGEVKNGYMGSGVLKSTDEGRTWARVSNNSLPAPGTITKIEVDPADANRVYVAQFTRLLNEKITSGGIYVSTDGGVNWQKTLVGGGRDVTIDASNPRTIYAGLMRIERETDPTPGLYRSTDRGATWTSLIPVQYQPGLRRDMKIAVTPANPQVIYVYMGGWLAAGFHAAFMVSTDGGATWTDRGVWQFDTGQFGFNTFLVADPSNANTVYLGSRDVYRTTDGGASWTNITRNFLPFAGFYDYSPQSSKTHPDQHAFAFAAGSSTQFYVGNDGGVSKTTDGGVTFQSLNSTLTLTQFTGISVHPTDPTVTVAGSQDNGTQRRYSSGQWYEVAHGDGGRSVFNPIDPTVVFITRQRGSILRFHDSGQSYAGQVAWDDTFGEPFGSTARMSFYPPFVGNGVDATLYIGTWRLFISTNQSETWNAPAGELDLTKGITEKGADVLTAIGVAASNTNVIYTGSAQGRAMRTTDGGTSWTDVTRGLPDRSITSVVAHPTNPAIAYLSVSGFKSSHVFKTTDMGATWTDASAGLPDIPTSALLIDPVSPETIYAGTDVGVFRSTTAGASWASFNKGMPPAIVTAFAAQPGGVIQVATYGRGAYEMLGTVRPSITGATFDGKKKLKIEGRGFGDSLRVMINGEDKTDRIVSATETTINVKSKLKKLALKAGDNNIQVISDDVSSNVFVLKLDL